VRQFKPTHLDYLQGFSDLGLRTHGAPTSFKTFLNIVETAGLTEELANGRPYLVLAPIDLASSTMATPQREALLSDPQAAGDFVRTHMIEASVPRGSLAKTPGGPLDLIYQALPDQYAHSRALTHIAHQSRGPRRSRSLSFAPARDEHHHTADVGQDTAVPVTVDLLDGKTAGGE
jgi:hypothetical protein